MFPIGTKIKFKISNSYCSIYDDLEFGDPIELFLLKNTSSVYRIDTTSLRISKQASVRHSSLRSASLSESTE